MFDESSEEKFREFFEHTENDETKPVSNRRSRQELENGALLASQLAKKRAFSVQSQFPPLFTPYPSFFND